MTPELQMLCKTGKFEPTPADHDDVRLLHARFGMAIPEMYGDRSWPGVGSRADGVPDVRGQQALRADGEP